MHLRQYPQIKALEMLPNWDSTIKLLPFVCSFNEVASSEYCPWEKATTSNNTLRPHPQINAVETYKALTLNCYFRNLILYLLSLLLLIFSLISSLWHDKKVNTAAELMKGLFSLIKVFVKSKRLGEIPCKRMNICWRFVLRGLGRFYASEKA